MGGILSVDLFVGLDYHLLMESNNVKRAIKMLRYSVLALLFLALLGVRWVFTSKTVVNNDKNQNSLNDARILIQKAQADVVGGDAGGDDDDSGGDGD